MKGLALGADGYITRPFEVDSARPQGVLGRAADPRDRRGVNPIGTADSRSARRAMTGR
jgi:DNA-binding response OmpR family regulator